MCRRGKPSWTREKRREFAQEFPEDENHFLGKVICALAKVVEADENDAIADIDSMKEILHNQEVSQYGLSDQWYKMWYPIYYEQYIKGSVEEKLIELKEMLEERESKISNGYIYRHHKSYVIDRGTMAMNVYITTKILTKDNNSLHYKLSAAQTCVYYILYFMQADIDWLMEHHKLYQKWANMKS